MNRNKTACNCRNITYGMIADAVAAGLTETEIEQKLRFGTGCGKCREFIRVLIRELAEERDAR
ncbi:MAG: (2Fe-2S)-binding protein [Clostridia bacterium]|nr:(2Fe-2S)-binding protein [Clostridia bacterium]